MAYNCLQSSDEQDRCKGAQGIPKHLLLVYMMSKLHQQMTVQQVWKLMQVRAAMLFLLDP